jgi:hypothetical protein
MGDNVALNGAFARTSTDAWVVGQQFGLAGQPVPPPVTYHWNGSTWSPVPVPALSAANALTAVSASSATDAWAVGFEVLGQHHRQAVLEHWNGSAWSPDTSDAVATSNATLTGVVDLSPANAWAVTAGSGSQGLAHWNGTAWSFAAFPDVNFTPSSGQAISASSASDVWVVGSTFNAATFASIPEAEHFDGTSWHTVPLAQPGSGSGKITAVAAISPTNAWAAGEATGGTSPVGGGTLIEHWNGTSWSVVPSPTPGFEPQISGIAARSASDVVVVGDTLPSQNGGPLDDVILRFNGNSWSDDTGGAIPGFLMAAAAAPGGAEEFAVGNSSGATGVILSHS